MEYAQTIFLRPVQPAGFLIKPVKMDYVYKLLLLAIERLKNDSQGRLIVQGKMRHTFCSWEILYLESKGHITEIHTASGKVYECKDKISELEQRAGKEFVRCHQSFLVNLRYVEGLGKEKRKREPRESPKESGSKNQRDVLILENEETIAVSKRWYGGTKIRLAEYFGENRKYNN